jgi:hypothetical protein
MKVDFEAAVLSAINKVFPDSVITGRDFYFNQCLWRQVKNVGLTVEYKKMNKLDLYAEFILLWRTYLSVK